MTQIDELPLPLSREQSLIDSLAKLNPTADQLAINGYKNGFRDGWDSGAMRYAPKVATKQELIDKLVAALLKAKRDIHQAIQLSAVYNGHTFDFSDAVRVLDEALVESNSVQS